MVYGTYTREGEGGLYIAQSSCNSIATMRAMQAGLKNERTIDSCRNNLKSKNIWYRPNPGLPT